MRFIKIFIICIALGLSVGFFCEAQKTDADLKAIELQDGDLSKLIKDKNLRKKVNDKQLSLYPTKYCRQGEDEGDLL